MLTLAQTTFSSRLFTGTGKFANPQLMARAIAASGSELVTLAMKRLDLRSASDATLAQLQALPVTLLPNTSGARTADEAVYAAGCHGNCCKHAGLNWKFILISVTCYPTR